MLGLKISPTRSLPRSAFDELVEELLNIYNDIPKMALEELPEYLVHENLLIRAHARARLGELIAQRERARK